MAAESTPQGRRLGCLIVLAAMAFTVLGLVYLASKGAS